MTFNVLPRTLTFPATEAPYPFSPASNYPLGRASGTGRPNTNQNTQSVLDSPPSHATGRPWGDNRSADEIVEDNPALSFFCSLTISNDYLEPLYQKVGDFSSNNPDPKARADAMYNLSQVIEYITLGPDSRASEEPGLPITDGNLPGRPRPAKNTNYELFNNFRLNGYSALKDPAADSQENQKTDVTEHNTETKTPDTVPDSKKTEAPPTTTPVTSNTGTKRTELNTDVAPTGPTGRPEGDMRSADQILKENHVIVNSRPKTISDEELIALVGNFTPSNPDPKSRADAAYNLACLLHYIDSITTEYQKRNFKATYSPEEEAATVTSYKNKNNGKIDGEYKALLPPPYDTPAIKEGSEAAILRRVVREKSYSALPADKSEYSTETRKAYPGDGELKNAENNYIVTV